MYGHAADRFGESRGLRKPAFYTGRTSEEHEEGCRDAAYSLQTILCEIEEILAEGDDGEIAKAASLYEKSSGDVESAGSTAWHDACFLTGRL